MEFLEKAKVRLEHWISHNEQHLNEFEVFAEQLEAAGKSGSAKYVREVVDKTAECTESLKKALHSLD